MHGWTAIPQQRCDELIAFSWNPLDGLRNIAAELMADWGHSATDHPAVVDALTMALSEEMIETAATVMRESGLRSPADVTP